MIVCSARLRPILRIADLVAGEPEVGGGCDVGPPQVVLACDPSGGWTETVQPGLELLTRIETAIRVMPADIATLGTIRGLAELLYEKLAPANAAQPERV